MNSRKRWFLFSVVITLLIFLFLYLSFLPVKCRNYECFRINMAQCNPATYINEEVEASWKYEIIGPKEDTCTVKVTLLQAKEGDLDLVKLEGESMLCSSPRGFTGYAEEDLSRCTGELKEHLQERVIQKLHQYIVDNIGEIREGFF